MLPDEVYEEILKRLDYFDLIKMKLVSKDWQALVTRIIERSYKWYQMCLKEIPKDYWSPLLELQTDPRICCDNFHAAKKHADIWMTMYKSWTGWNALVKSPSHEIVEVFDAQKWVRNLAVSSNIVAIGHENHITIFDIAQSDLNPIYKVDQRWDVRDLQLWRKGSDVIAVSASHNRVYYWDVKAKSQIQETVRPRDSMQEPAISTSFDYCHTLMAYPCHENENSDPEEEECFDDEDIDHYILNVKRFGPDLAGESFGIDNVGFINAIGSDRERVMLPVEYPWTCCLTIYEHLSHRRLKQRCIMRVHKDANLRIKLFESGVVACVDYEKFKLGFSVAEKYKFYDVRRDLHLSHAVTAVVYHIGLLIVGLQSGEVHIIQVKDVNRLITLKLKTMESMKFKLSSRSVDFLKVTEFNSTQYLVAVSDQKLHLVKFNSS